MEKSLKPGSVVVFIDSERRRHNALVTEAHGDELGRVARYRQTEDGKIVYDEKGLYPEIESYGPEGENWPCINLTYVSDDPKKHDSYGRQLERDSTSVPYLDDSTAAGYCFFFLGEEDRAEELTLRALAEERRRRDAEKSA